MHAYTVITNRHIKSHQIPSNLVLWYQYLKIIIIIIRIGTYPFQSASFLKLQVKYLGLKNGNKITFKTNHHAISRKDFLPAPLPQRVYGQAYADVTTKICRMDAALTPVYKLIRIGTYLYLFVFFAKLPFKFLELKNSN